METGRTADWDYLHLQIPSFLEAYCTAVVRGASAGKRTGQVGRRSSEDSPKPRRRNGRVPREDVGRLPDHSAGPSHADPIPHAASAEPGCFRRHADGPKVPPFYDSIQRHDRTCRGTFFDCRQGRAQGRLQGKGSHQGIVALPGKVSHR